MVSHTMSKNVFIQDLLDNNRDSVNFNEFMRSFPVLAGWTINKHWWSGWEVTQITGQLYLLFTSLVSQTKNDSSPHLLFLSSFLTWSMTRTLSSFVGIGFIPACCKRPLKINNARKNSSGHTVRLTADTARSKHSLSPVGLSLLVRTLPYAVFNGWWCLLTISTAPGACIVTLFRFTSSASEDSFSSLAVQDVPWPTTR